MTMPDSEASVIEVDARRAARRRGGQARAKQCVEAAEKWKKEAEKVVRRVRAADPGMGHKRLADQIKKSIPSAPEVGTVITFIRRLERREVDRLPRSQKHPWEKAKQHREQINQPE